MEQNQSMEFLIKALARELEQHERKAFASTELARLTASQMEYLETIRGMDKPTVSQLAKTLGVSKPTVTLTVEKLMAKGLVGKDPSTSDRRVSFIHLTPEGAHLAALYANVHTQFGELFGAALSKQELAQFASLLSKALSGIRSA